MKPKIRGLFRVRGQRRVQGTHGGGRRRRWRRRAPRLPQRDQRAGDGHGLHRPGDAGDGRQPGRDHGLHHADARAPASSPPCVRAASRASIVGNDVLAPARDVEEDRRPAWSASRSRLSFSRRRESSRPEATAFVADVSTRSTAAAPDQYAAQGYEAMWLIAQALHGRWTRQPTRESLAQALSKQATIEHNVYGGLADEGRAGGDRRH